MLAILEKCSDEHFRWKFEIAISWIWNLEISSFPMMYDSFSPSQWYHLGEFWLVYHGLFSVAQDQQVKTTAMEAGDQKVFTSPNHFKFPVRKRP